MADETYEEDPLEEEFVEEEEPEPVLTSEQEWVNRKAEALNIDPFDLDVEYAHQAVEDTCASMDEVRRHKRVEEIGGASPEMLRLYQLGIPKLCPKHRAVAQAIGDGTIPLYVGTYEVGRGAGKVAPGTWQLKDSVDDCYWERTTPGGDIIDNHFATHATVITINVEATDGSLTIEGCGGFRFLG